MGCHREVEHKILLLNLFLPSVESKQSTPVYSKHCGLAPGGGGHYPILTNLI